MRANPASSMTVRTSQLSHLGSFLGRAPTGRSIRWPGVACYELDNDCRRIFTESFFYDSASLLAQLDPV